MLPSAPASRAGMQIKLFCGLAATNAARWCAPRQHRLRRIQSSLDDASEAARLHAYLSEAPAAPQAPEVRRRRLLQRLLGIGKDGGDTSAGNAGDGSKETATCGVDTPGDYDFEEVLDEEDLAAEAAARLRAGLIAYGRRDSDSEDDSGSDSDAANDSEYARDDFGAKTGRGGVAAFSTASAAAATGIQEVSETFIENFGIGAHSQQRTGRSGSRTSAATDAVPRQRQRQKKTVGNANINAGILSAAVKSGGGISNGEGDGNRDGVEAGSQRDLDTGVLQHPGELELELVMRVNYDSAELLLQVTHALPLSLSPSLPPSLPLSLPLSLFLPQYLSPSLHRSITTDLSTFLFPSACHIFLFSGHPF